MERLSIRYYATALFCFIAFGIFFYTLDGQGKFLVLGMILFVSATVWGIVKLVENTGEEVSTPEWEKDHQRKMFDTSKDPSHLSLIDTHLSSQLKKNIKEKFKIAFFTTTLFLFAFVTAVVLIVFFREHLM